jgi:exodeoxyribonuclease VII large subunit
LSPLRVLGRGYALPVAEDGRVLKRSADFLTGQPFRLRVTDGDVRARVE